MPASLQVLSHAVTWILNKEHAGYRAFTLRHLVVMCSTGDRGDAGGEKGGP